MWIICGFCGDKFVTQRNPRYKQNTRKQDNQWGLVASCMLKKWHLTNELYMFSVFE